MLRPVDSDRPPPPDSDPPPPLLPELKFRQWTSFLRQLAVWGMVIAGVIGAALGILNYASSFAKATRVEKLEATQADALQQLADLKGKQADHVQLHQQEAREVQAIHQDVRDIRDLQQKALEQAIISAHAAHTRTVSMPILRTPNHEEP